MRREGEDGIETAWLPDRLNHLIKYLGDSLNSQGEPREGRRIVFQGAATQ